jgi:hypothetical protein
MKLSQGYEVAGEVFTEGHIIQSHDSLAVRSLNFYIYVAVSLNRDLVFSCPHEISRVGGSEIQEISLRIWMVVPESRMVEFLSGYYSIEKAGSFIDLISYKECRVNFPYAPH